METGMSSYTICKPGILHGSPLIRMARSQMVDQAVHPSQPTDAMWHSNRRLRTSYPTTRMAQMMSSYMICKPGILGVFRSIRAAYKLTVHRAIPTYGADRPSRPMGAL